MARLERELGGRERPNASWPGARAAQPDRDIALNRPRPGNRTGCDRSSMTGEGRAKAGRLDGRKERATNTSAVDGSREFGYVPLNLSGYT